MAVPKNYTELTDKMLKLFQDLEDDKVNIDRANTMVKTSNAIINIQRTKILSTRVTGENTIKFFKD
jgi:hypothetical protein